LEVLAGAALAVAAALAVFRVLTGAAAVLAFTLTGVTDLDDAGAADLTGAGFFTEVGFLTGAGFLTTTAFLAGIAFLVGTAFLVGNAFLAGAALALLAVTGVAAFLFEVFTSCLLAV
jgi:hypothetical protein